MCGILAYLGKQYKKEDLIKFLLKNKHRGPDNSKYLYLKNELFLGFNRLRINGLDDGSDQPFQIENCLLICNGEIYNFKTLKKTYDFGNCYKSNSDCEVIIHMYRKFGIERTLNELDGVFSFFLYDIENKRVIIARDPIGIRSLYFSFNADEIVVASEMKSLTSFDNVEQFPSGTYWSSENNKFKKYYSYDYRINLIYHNDNDSIYDNINKLFTEAVEKRLLSDRKVACLLSGGLDSTLTTAVVAKKLGEFNVNTYSIGMKGSVDLKYAQIAADYLKTNHTSIELTEKQFLDAIEKTIYQIESWDTTSVRASVGNYLISLYIRDNSKDVVIYCGDVSDEIFASYRGFMCAESEENFYRENIRMIRDIRYFDVLRSDKSISGAGLEARVPFSDKKLIDYIMSLEPKYKMFNDKKMEKHILRKAFKGYLPDELLWRRKEAFSDGVSSYKRSWFNVIKEHVNKKYTDKEFEEKKLKYSYNTPYDKESLYYREIFEKYYPGKAKTIPYFWRHPFSKILDPSARLLDCYTDNNKEEEV